MAMFHLLFEFRRDVFGVLLMALEYLQAGFQQALQLGIVRRRNQRALERAVHGLMVGDLVVDIRLVERRAVELSEFFALGGALLGQRAAGIVVLRRYLELLDQRQRLLVHRRVIANQIGREGPNFFVLGFFQRLFGGFDIELPRRIGDGGDLRIGRS